MGEEVETGHQQDGVDGQEPMLLEHLLDLVQEDSGFGTGGLSGVVPPFFSSTDEDLAFGEKSAQDGAEGGDAGGGPEESTPGGVGNEVEVDDGGNEVTDGVTLLEDTAGKTTSLDGKVLKGGGGG